jgi:hypothetical protein
MAEAATEVRPLTADERATLDKLLARASADKTPATRIGEPYEALTCLSVPRRGGGKETDLAMKGETVYLTEEEARQFERHGARDGRQVPVIRKLSGPDGSRGPVARLLPRHLSGRLFRPMMPPPGTELPRPDPPESSLIQVIDDGRAPESDGAMSPEPSEMDDHLRQAAPDAVDLPPSRSRARAAR